MADGDAIIQDVLLRGQDDIKSAFASIEQAGVQMFANLQRASETSNLTKLTTGVGALLVAVSAITVATFGWATASASATTALGRLADQGGTTIEDMSTLTAALKTDSETLGTAFKRMAVRIETEWPIIQKAQRDAANLMEADSIAIQKSYLDLEKAQQALTVSGKNAADLQISNANSVRAAQLSLKDALEAQRIAAGGEADPNFNAQQGREKAALAVQQARLALSQAQQKADEDAALAANKLKTEQLAAQEAALKLSEAQKKAAEDSANDINNLTQFVNNLAAGVKDANLKVNASAENVVKGLIASIGPSAQALQGLKGDITDVASAPPILRDALLKLADVFHNTQDNALKTAVSVQLFGRGVGQEMVEQLSKGSASILAAQKRFADLGLVLTENDRVISKQLKGSLADLSNEVRIIGQQFALTFAPTFTAVLQTMFSTVADGRQTFLDFAKAINGVVTPAIVGLLQTITGADFKKGFDFTDEQKKAVDGWQRTFDSIAGVVKSGALVVGAALSGIAELLTKFTHTDFSSIEIGLDLLLLRFGGIAGAVIVIGIALDKVTDGALSRFIERTVALAKFLAGGATDFATLDKTLADIDARAANSGKSLSQNIGDAQKQVAVDAGSMGKAIADALAQATTNAQAAAIGIGKVSTAAIEAETALTRVSKIKVVGVDEQAPGPNVFSKAPSASKSFGAFGQMIEDAKKLSDAFGTANDDVTTLGETVDEVGKKKIALRVDIQRLTPSDLEALLPPSIGEKLGNELKQGFTDALDLIKDAIIKNRDATRAELGGDWVGIKEIKAGFEQLPEFIATVDQQIVEFFTKMPADIGDQIIAGVGAIVAPFQSAAEQIIAALEPVSRKIGELLLGIAGVNSAAAQLPGGSGGGTGSGIPANDDGGLFRGRPGRDANLSWLTDREFIFSRRATEAWTPGLLHWMNLKGKQGTSGMFAALSRSIASPIRRFADGGFNSTAALAPFFPGVADPADERSFTLSLASGNSGRVRGPRSLIDELERIATAEQSSRIGQDLWGR